jgi:hypothetical protein
MTRAGQRVDNRADPEVESLPTPKPLTKSEEAEDGLPREEPIFGSLFGS